MYELSVKGRFSAAHRLRGYPGSCAELHGHNWEVTLYVGGERLGEDGMLVDFRELKRRLHTVLETLDHRDLNAVEALRGKNPTSEVIARFLYEQLAPLGGDGPLRVRRVTVSETPETTASYGRHD